MLVLTTSRKLFPNYTRKDGQLNVYSCSTKHVKFAC